MSEFITYKIPLLKGITDLKGQLPGHGATDWWTSEQWDKWHDELPAMKAWNEQYIKDCKADGTYGEKYDITLNLKPNPLFDTPNLILGTEPFSSYKMLFIDAEKLTHDKDI